MKLAYMKVALTLPARDDKPPMIDISLYSCPILGGTAESTLRTVRRRAKQQKVEATYDLCTFVEYATIRAARTWLYTEPHDDVADRTFKLAMVRAGLFEDMGDIQAVACTGENDFLIRVLTQDTQTTIDTNTCAIKTEPLFQAKVAPAYE